MKVSSQIQAWAVLTSRKESDKHWTENWVKPQKKSYQILHLKKSLFHPQNPTAFTENFVTIFTDTHTKNEKYNRLCSASSYRMCLKVYELAFGSQLKRWHESVS